jgi:hypothetical protein
LIYQNAKTASIRVVVIVGTNAHTIYGENVEPKDLILECNLNVTILRGLKA